MSSKLERYIPNLQPDMTAPQVYDAYRLAQIRCEELVMWSEWDRFEGKSKAEMAAKIRELESKAMTFPALAKRLRQAELEAAESWGLKAQLKYLQEQLETSRRLLREFAERKAKRTRRKPAKKVKPPEAPQRPRPVFIGMDCD